MQKTLFCNPCEKCRSIHIKIHINHSPSGKKINMKYYCSECFNSGPTIDHVSQKNGGYNKQNTKAIIAWNKLNKREGQDEKKY